MQRINLQPAFVLHTRPFRDTSLLVELFTLEHGRISALARGARTKYKGQLRSFIPLLISWAGKTELVSLTQAEVSAAPYYLTGIQLLSGMYVNELLMHLLHRHDSHPELYKAYQILLESLPQNNTPEALLRYFEKQLLAELGYGLSLTHEADSQSAIQPELFYRFDPDRGLLVTPVTLANEAALFSGKSLLAYANEQLVDKDDLRAIKRLMRIAIGHLLGDKVIRSRELFI